ncbi:hypothetical protein EPN28_00485 [Patescibacteria group bacterium]|nr:MAG: hypothetical protein EPN28_00485 [Patescibacteria group bacterium]
MKLTILGSGTDASHLAGIANRFPPGFLVEWNEHKLLIECSEGIRFRLEKIGVDYADIRHLAISHAHPDHYALPQFLQSVWNKIMWSGKNYDHELEIFCTKDIADNYNKLWNLYRPGEDYLPKPKLIFKPMSNGEQYELGGAKLSAANVSHSKMDALAFRLELNNRALVYSGDTDDCLGIRKIAKDADIFICECSALIGAEKTSLTTHLNPFQIGAIARDSAVKKLILTHYSGLNSDEEMTNECRRAGFKGEITIGKDFQTFEI